MSKAGIWGHSSTVGGASFIIATPDDPKDLPMIETIIMQHANFDPGYKLLYGYWHGVREQPIMFEAHLWMYVRQYFVGQEAIALLGPADARDNRPIQFMTPVQDALVQYTHPDLRPDMKLVEVTKEEVDPQVGYTFDPTTGRYYIAK